MSEAASDMISDLAVEVHIDASPEAVWRALTDDIGKWWPAPFYGGGEDGSRTFHLEAQAGGRMYEQWADGGSLLWAQVCTVKPQEMLQATGLAFPEWGGPAIWFGTWSLEAGDSGCTLRFTEYALGRSADDYVESKTKGWGFLNDTLKAYLEGTPAPEWKD